MTGTRRSARSNSATNHDEQDAVKEAPASMEVEAETTENVISPGRGREKRAPSTSEESEASVTGSRRGRSRSNSKASKEEAQETIHGNDNNGNEKDVASTLMVADDGASRLTGAPSAS